MVLLSALLPIIEKVLISTLAAGGHWQDMLGSEEVSGFVLACF